MNPGPWLSRSPALGSAVLLGAWVCSCGLSVQGMGTEAELPVDTPDSGGSGSPAPLCAGCLLVDASAGRADARADAPADSTRDDARAPSEGSTIDAKEPAETGSADAQQGCLNGATLCASRSETCCAQPGSPYYGACTAYALCPPYTPPDAGYTIPDAGYVFPEGGRPTCLNGGYACPPPAPCCTVPTSASYGMCASQPGCK